MEDGSGVAPNGHTRNQLLLQLQQHITLAKREVVVTLLDNQQSLAIILKLEILLHVQRNIAMLMLALVALPQQNILRHYFGVQGHLSKWNMH